MSYKIISGREVEENKVEHHYNEPVQSRSPSTNPKTSSKKLGAVEFLTFDLTSDTFRLSNEARTYLQGLKGAIYITSISGAPRIGKSTLLNLLISLIRCQANCQDRQKKMLYEDTFKTKDGMESITQAVDMFSVEKDGTNYVFLDIEGGEDATNSDLDHTWYYQSLLTTAVSISHTHIFFYETTPGKTFVNNLKLAENLVSKNNIHNGFRTHYNFIRKDCNSKDDLEECRKHLKKIQNIKDLSYFAQILSKSPDHICGRHKSDKISCIKDNSWICESCQKDEFIKDLTHILTVICGQFQQSQAFRSAEEIFSVFEKMNTVLKRDFSKFSNQDMITKLRLKRYEQRGYEISEKCQTIDCLSIKNPLSQKIRDMIGNERYLESDQILLSDLGSTHRDVTVKLDQTQFLIEEIRKFVVNELLNEDFPVYNEAERDSIADAYIEPLKKSIKRLYDVISSYQGNISKAIPFIKSKLKELVDCIQDDGKEMDQRGVQVLLGTSLCVIAGASASFLDPTLGMITLLSNLAVCGLKMVLRE